MENAYICDGIRTPIGRYGGALSAVRADDLAAIPIAALVARNPGVDWNALDDVIYGCANQSGEDNRNVGRMALLLAGLPKEVPGSTVNRLCGSSMDAVTTASRAIKSGEADLIIAGGVESMSRSPFVVGKADAAFSRSVKLEDTTMGWRFINPAMKAKYGTDSMPETGETWPKNIKFRARIRTLLHCAATSERPPRFATGVWRTKLSACRCRRKKAIRFASTKTSIRGRTRLWKRWRN